MTGTAVQSRIVPAPILVLGFLTAGFIANHFHPLPILAAAPALLVASGLVLVAIALGIGLAGVRQFHKHGTPTNPYAPATAIVASGIFRVTRNPMYLGLVLLAFGAAIGFNSWWLVAASVLLGLSIHWLVIKREERYLLSRFGAQYESYLTRTRRWL